MRKLSKLAQLTAAAKTICEQKKEEISKLSAIDPKWGEHMCTTFGWEPAIGKAEVTKAAKAAGVPLDKWRFGKNVRPSKMKTAIPTCVADELNQAYHRIYDKKGD